MSAGVFVDMVTQNAITSGGPTQTFTGSLGGNTPKAAIFVVSKAFVDNSPLSMASFSFGFTDKLANYSVGVATDNGTANSATARKCRNDSLICLIGTLAAPESRSMAMATYSSSAANSITISWSSFPTYALLVTCYMFGGDDYEAYAGTFTNHIQIDQTATATFGGTMAGATCDAVILAGCEEPAYNAVSMATILKLIIGFADRQATPTQVSHNWNQNQNTTRSQGANRVAYDYAAWDANTSGARSIFLKDFIAGGFTAQTLLGGGVESVWPYLAMKFNGPNGSCSHWSGIVDSPSGTGTKVEISPGFKPQFVFQLTSSIANTLGTIGTNSTANPLGAGSFGVVGLAAPLGVGKISSCNVVDFDNAATMATSNYASPQLFYHRANSGAMMFSAQPTSLVMTSLGWNLAYTANTTTIRRWPTLVIGEFVAAPVGGNVVPEIDNSYRQRRA